MAQGGFCQVVITDLGSDRNKGDSAILESVVGRVREFRPSAEVRFLSSFGWSDRRLVEEYPRTRALATGGQDGILGSVFPIVPPDLRDAPRAVLYTLRAAAFALRIPLPRWAWTPAERRTHDALRKADLVINNGGGSLFGECGARATIRLFRVLFPCVMASVYRRPFVIYGQSVGPFAGRFQVWLARRVLDRAAAVLVREAVSAATLERIGLRAPFKTIPDPAFGLPAGDTARDEARGVLASYGVPEDRPLVGVTVRHWHFGHRDDGQALQGNYVRSVAAALDALAEAAGTHAVLWPQCTGFIALEDDRPLSREVRGASRHPEAITVIEDELAPAVLKAGSGLMEMFIGTRFHSVIFALTEFVPALAMSYWGPKAEGIMTALGLEECLLPIGEVSPGGLAAAALGLWSRRVEMRAYLEERVRPVVAEARRLDPWVAELLDAPQGRGGVAR